VNSPTNPELAPWPLAHRVCVLPAVPVAAFNEELRDDEGPVGDRASRPTFHAYWRRFHSNATGRGAFTPTRD
jgi:hypothetical protein